MKPAIVLLPGLNRDRDMIAAIRTITGQEPLTLWQTETSIPADVGLVIIPGGFSFGDYLRCGAIGARMPVMRAVADAASRGVRVLGVCNGFQLLVETGLLPGALMRNASLNFVCRTVQLEVSNADTVFTRGYSSGHVFDCPVAHHDGNYFADADTLTMLKTAGRIAFRYANGTNPNGSVDDIAGITNAKGNVLGMMPHPENRVEAAHGGSEWRVLFESALDLVAA